MVSESNSTGRGSVGDAPRDDARPPPLPTPRIYIYCQIATVMESEGNGYGVREWLLWC
jgi:hypothetical protein